MGLGLWLSASSARFLLGHGLLPEWGNWFQEMGLVPFTFNGFPFGDFHQRAVKFQVYLPTWWQVERLRYTLDLIHIMDALLPPGQEGSISTLPVAWGQPAPTTEEINRAVGVRELAHREQETGRRIVLCLEPEPGCLLQVSQDVVRFFEDLLLPGRNETLLRRYLGVCHDVCHQVVMFEEQAEALARYRAAGITVGKVQVSSAVILPLDRIPLTYHQSALDQLAGFNEERYLHQTTIRLHPEARPLFFNDLSAALVSGEGQPWAGEWRVHFHVPIYLQRFGYLEASQSALRDCLRTLAEHGHTTHFEVETYAWNVLPPELKKPDLDAGIAEEMGWLQEVFQKQNQEI
jgi:hypothetical protein